MKAIKIFTILVLALSLMFCSARVSKAEPMGTAWTYQGRLIDANKPADGLYDFQFKLYDENVVGIQQGSTIDVNNLDVIDGYFTVELDFGSSVFNGDARWLEISVRAADSGDNLTTLNPRQEVTATPYALQTRGIFVDSLLNVGFGTTSPTGKLHVNGGMAAPNNNGTDIVIEAQQGGIGNPDGYDGGNIIFLPGEGGYGTIGGTRGEKGNVGIGTDNPTRDLHIYRDDGPANVGIVAADNSSKAQVIFGDGMGNQWTISSDNTDDNKFHFRSGRAAGTIRATFQQDGKVGIGTTSPSSRLHVAGVVTAEAFAGAGALSWHEVTGTSHQALPNTGYMVNNAEQVAITLPVTPVVGDIVRVSCANIWGGGWKIAQNSGQSVITRLIETDWRPRGNNRDWYCVASSSDGTKLVAVVHGGQIYTSTDSGVSWAPRESNRNWSSVASSADGTKLVATDYGGQIYTSTDSGISWTPRQYNRDWISVASSVDGTKLVAAVGVGQIFTSTDSGISWTPRENSRTWFSVASSADGTKLVAVVLDGQIYTSTDSGISWTPRESRRFWYSVASSADGTKLVAVGGGYIFTSTDSGISWMPRASGQPWDSVASSVDGTKLVAAVGGGQIYTSTDSGVSWMSCESNRSWQAVASSADGVRMVAVEDGGQIYTSALTTSLGTPGYLTGNQDATIEVQFIGNGVWRFLSHEGIIKGN